MSNGIGPASDGWYGGGTGGVDSTPPAVSVISPLPGVAAGEPGGFPRNYNAAKDTPIVMEITDLTSPIRYVMVAARFSDSDAEEVIYRRGQFRGLYITGSTQAMM